MAASLFHFFVTSVFPFGPNKIKRLVHRTALKPRWRIKGSEGAQCMLVKFVELKAVCTESLSQKCEQGTSLKTIGTAIYRTWHCWEFWNDTFHQRIIKFPPKSKLPILRMSFFFFFFLMIASKRQKEKRRQKTKYILPLLLPHMVSSSAHSQVPPFHLSRSARDLNKAAQERASHSSNILLTYKRLSPALRRGSSLKVGSFFVCFFFVLF